MVVLSANFSFRSSPYRMTPLARRRRRRECLLWFNIGRSFPGVILQGNVQNIKDGRCWDHLHTILSTVFRRAAQNIPYQKNEIRELILSAKVLIY